jgi:hypothetical protein
MKKILLLASLQLLVLELANIAVFAGVLAAAGVFALL